MQRQLSISAMPKLLPEEASDGDDLEAKPEKAPAPRSAGKERSVHLIPLIIVLCFLLLFLCSHDPSPSDMSGFGKKAGSGRTRLLLPTDRVEN
ncbi:hypothetical protein BS78_06G211800 [Paspalum vaginatum]|nr:hypothetical protein BS78_06G211800 [Paspalum vaginatum]